MPQGNISNRVTLHDDNKTILRRVMSSIERGAIDDEGLSWDYYSLSTEYSHRVFVEMLPVLHKYDCPDLHAEVVAEIAGGFEAYLDNCYNPQSFIERHYDPIVSGCGGAYPERLYRSFAEALKAFKLGNEETDKLSAIVKANPALAAFLAEYYCNIITYAIRATAFTELVMRDALNGKGHLHFDPVDEDEDESKSPSDGGSVQAIIRRMTEL